MATTEADRWCTDLPAGPLIFPAHVRPTRWNKGHFLSALSLPCVPVQGRGTRVGAWIVLQSIRNATNGIVIDSSTIVRSTVLLSSMRLVLTSRGVPVAHYRPALHNLAVRFPAPYATARSRAIRTTGSYRVAGTKRLACFESVPLPTCVG